MRRAALILAALVCLWPLGEAARARPEAAALAAAPPRRLVVFEGFDNPG